MTVPDLSKGDPATRFQDALQALRNPGFLKSPRYQEQQTRALREGAHPDIVEFSRKFVKRLASLGVPAFAHCIVRTEQEQFKLFLDGFSKDSPEDGFWPHMAYAVGIIHSQFGWMDNPSIPHAWELFGHIGKEVALSMGIKIIWGGDFVRFPDPAHWELEHWASMASMEKAWGDRDALKPPSAIKL